MMAVEKRKHKTKVLNEKMFNELIKNEKENPDKPVEQIPGEVQETSPAFDEKSGTNLNIVVDHYHKKVNNKLGLDWLEKQGLTNQEMYETYQLGFVDGSLPEVTGDNQKKELITLGVLNDNYYEHFNNCITIPIFDENKQVVELHGIDIETNEFVKPIILKNIPTLFNQGVIKSYDEVILTEDLLDALSLIQLDIKNVISISHHDEFKTEYIKLLQDNRVKTVIIAFKNDVDNVFDTDTIKDLLVMEGFKVKKIFPLTQKSWSEELLSGTAKTNIVDQIDLAEEYKSEQIAVGSFKATKDKFGFTFQINDITYKVSGFKETAINDFKVSIRSEYQGDWFPDMVNLQVSRSREAFAGKLSQQFNIETKKIEKDLLMIFDYLSNEQIKRFSGNGKKDIPEMTEEEIKTGMDFLKSPDLYQQVIGDMTALGYVGEEINKVLVWLIGISRLLPKPLSIFIQSPASTGKSYLLEILQKLLPLETVEWVTSSSDQAFNYMPEEDFIGKIFMMGEALHNEIIEGYIRQMQSENMLSRRVVIKDPKTGQMKTVTLKHIVKLVFMMTSTAMKVNLENLSRCIVVRVDDSKNQTELVLEMQRYQENWENFLKEKHVNPQIIKKHIIAQRLLKRIIIINPYEKYIRFPAIRPVMRRGQMQFLGLIRSSCTARQMQKVPVEKIDTYTGKKEFVYECDLIDYEVARKLFIEGGLLQADDDLSLSVIMLYEAIRRFVKNKAKKEKLKSDEVSFIQSDVRELTELSAIAVRKYIKILVDYEYLEVIGGKRHGTRFCYKLREDKSINEVDISAIIPTVEEIKRLMEEEKIN